MSKNALPNNYHDYVIRDGRLVGKFEEMYRNCPDPWPETEDDLENNPCSNRTRQVIANQGYKKVLSIGSGKGMYLNWLSRRCPDTVFTGCEVSKTAVEYSRTHYPHIQAKCLDIEAYRNYTWDFDLILFREVIWYILDSWQVVCEDLARHYSGRHIIVELSFYDTQTYGNEFFSGPDEFVDRFPFEILEIVRCHLTCEQREGMLLVYGKVCSQSSNN